MKIGFDLDGTLYQFPDIFKKLCEALHGFRHDLYIVSNHSSEAWQADSERLAKMGFDPRWFDISLLSPAEGDATVGRKKALMADKMDMVFDDMNVNFQYLTNTPVFKVPVLQEDKT